MSNHFNKQINVMTAPQSHSVYTHPTNSLFIYCISQK